MSRRHLPLSAHDVAVATPCDMPRSEMEVRGRGLLHCARCDKNVHLLWELDAQEARGVVAKGACIAVAYDEQGLVVLNDRAERAPSGAHPSAKRPRRMAAALMAAAPLFAAGCREPVYTATMGAPPMPPPSASTASPIGPPPPASSEPVRMGEFEPPVAPASSASSPAPSVGPPAPPAPPRVGRAAVKPTSR